MTVIYTIGTGSTWDNNELRYSLRSLERCKNVGEVILAGFCPEWVDRSAVRHIYIGDEYHHAHLNITHKIVEAAKAFSGDFVVMSDDHILLKAFDFDHLPLWHKGELNNVMGNSYQTSIAETRTFLRARNMSAYATNLHFPKLYTREAFERCLPFFRIAAGYQYGLEPSVLIGNTQISMGMQYTYHADNKTNEPQPRASFVSLMPDVAPEMAEWLQHRFPNKSHYEK